MAWVIWAGVFAPSASLEARDVGFVSHTDATIEVRWELTAPPDTPVSCALRGQSEKHAIVGWVVVDVPPSPEHTRTLSHTFRTSEPTVSGSVYRCWIDDVPATSSAFGGQVS